MWPIFYTLNRLFSRQKHPVIIVGIDYPAYALCQQLLHKNAPFQPAFFIDDEPWTHRTYILNTQVRYSSELLALTRNHGIKAVFCLDAQIFEEYRKRYAESLQKAGCTLVLFSGNQSLIELASRLQ